LFYDLPVKAGQPEMGIISPELAFTSLAPYPIFQRCQYGLFRTEPACTPDKGLIEKVNVETLRRKPNDSI
jgi:hypothetical protein